MIYVRKRHFPDVGSTIYYRKLRFRSAENGIYGGKRHSPDGGSGIYGRKWHFFKRKLELYKKMCTFASGLS